MIYWNILLSKLFIKIIYDIIYMSGIEKLKLDGNENCLMRVECLFFKMKEFWKLVL